MTIQYEIVAIGWEYHPAETYVEAEHYWDLDNGSHLCVGLDYQSRYWKDYFYECLEEAPRYHVQTSFYALRFKPCPPDGLLDFLQDGGWLDVYNQPADFKIIVDHLNWVINQAIAKVDAREGTVIVTYQIESHGFIDSYSYDGPDYDVKAIGILDMGRLPEITVKGAGQ